MPKIYNIELSEDEVLMAEDMGLSDYIEYDDNDEAMKQFETPEFEIKK